MKTVVVEIPDSKAYLIPIGCLHVGDKGFNDLAEKKVKGYIDWVKERDNARIFLMGDILNCASRRSKTSPFEQDMTLGEQIEKAIEIFEPVKDKIVGAITGNHEFRLYDEFGYNPTTSLCHRLGDVPYLGYSAIVDFKIGKKKRGGGISNKIQYTGYFHHNDGGGGNTLGNKMKRVEELGKLLMNADFYCGGHTHLLGVIPDTAVMYDPQNGTVQEKSQALVSTGGYLKWEDSYAEKKALRSLKIGSPRIRMDGMKKDVHVNI